MDNQRGNIEVSLPGAGDSEPTILEVINRNTITNPETEAQTETETTSPESSTVQQTTSLETEKELLLTDDVSSSKTKPLTTEQLHNIAKNTLGNINLNTIDTEKIDSGNILDIESHLIETFENFSVSEKNDPTGVAIRECQPAKEELKRSSQIETETSPKTIIEVEPSIPKVLKPIELDLDLNIKKQVGIETTDITNAAIPDSVKEQSDKFIATERDHQVKNFTSHIEEQKDEYNKSENKPQNLYQKEENDTITNPIDSGIGIGINGLQNCTTPLEEEEKKKLLDSLPQLDDNDSNSLSIQAKKEYYQLLRDYLDKHQDDRPPVPIQTYRWEDLRRAKEKGGYPWTHLYKRPLGPDEEPEIVLLLRKSQEFRFSSESPKSLKKVRIHDQVLVKETERYINDLSDTEDNPEVIIEDSKNTEDNHSINSESAASLQSDSLTKKSKLSKLKGILKRRSGTNENKLNSPKKSTNQTAETTKDGEDNHSLHSESGISDSVPEGKKSKLNKLKGLVKRQSGDVTSKKPKESASIFYSISPDDTSTEGNQSLHSETTEDKRSKFNKFIDNIKKGKNSDIEKINEKESPSLTNPVTNTSSHNNEQAVSDNRSIHSESAIFGFSDSEVKKSKLGKLKGFVKRRSGDKKQEDTKSVQSESAISSKSDSALGSKKSKLKKLQGALKFRKDIEKGKEKEKEEDNEKEKEKENISTNPTTEDTHSIQSESVSEAKKSNFSKLQGLIKRKSDKKSEIKQEDTKSIQSESAVSSKSDSTLERKKRKFNILKGVFKSQQSSDTQKSEELEKATTDLDEPSNPDSYTEDTKSIHSETQSSESISASKSKVPKLKKLKGIVKRRGGGKKPRKKKVISSSVTTENTTEVENSSRSEDSPKKEKCCRPIMDKLKILTDKQFKKRNIKKVSLKDDEKIVLEEQKILKLRESPKSVRGEIPKFVEKQDSEDLLEIVQLEESPSQKRKELTSSILIPDEIIDIPSHTLKVQEKQQNIEPPITPEPTVSEILEAELKSTPPVKALRKMKAHIYEDIENNEPTIEMKIEEILQLASVEALKKSLAAQDQNILKDIESNKQIPLDRMGSSEEETEKTSNLAPISSIDSASSDEQEKRVHLSPVAEESDACSTDGKDVVIIEQNHELDVKSALKREASPSPSVGDKKVTFSHIEDEAEPHREDIEIPEELKGMPNRWSTMK